MTKTKKPLSSATIRPDQALALAEAKAVPLLEEHFGKLLRERHPKMLEGRELLDCMPDEAAVNSSASAARRTR